MRGVHLFMILVALPAIAALGHDIYLFYINHGLDNIPGDLERSIQDKGPLSIFAALGFIWTQYDPESYKTVVESLDQETWDMLNSLLAQKALFVGIAFAGFFYVILFFTEAAWGMAIQ